MAKGNCSCFLCMNLSRAVPTGEAKLSFIIKNDEMFKVRKGRSKLFLLQTLKGVVFLQSFAKFYKKNVFFKFEIYIFRRQGRGFYNLITFVTNTDFLAAILKI